MRWKDNQSSVKQGIGKKVGKFLDREQEIELRYTGKNFQMVEKTVLLISKVYDP